MTPQDSIMIDRFLAFVEHTKLSDKAFCNEVQISIYTLSKVRSKREPLRGIVFMRTLQRYPQLNGNWIINNIGTMLNSFKDESRVQELTNQLSLANEKILFLTEQVGFYKEQLAELKKGVVK